jgi:preprotein translocase subunit SecD
MITIMLRAGALPAPLVIIEERSIGPTLGQDSIRSGFMAFLIGTIIILVFMVIYYKTSGIVADIAILLNMVLIMAGLSFFKSTLTLPGKAGIILTVGMAIDANVLIFERIREEIRTGKTVRAAIDSGYDRAFRTILDANITTLITAIILYYFGTVPLRALLLLFRSVSSSVCLLQFLLPDLYSIM